ncbi:MAG: hypothetical protein HY673_24730 [Chloroflexi bacterium]|nr:hypothetical protein [Chloroflexota bacterium]
MKEKKSTSNSLTTFTYEDTSGGNYGKGRRTGMNDPSGAAGSMAYKYDSRGRLVQDARTFGSDYPDLGHSEPPDRGHRRRQLRL